MTRTGQPAASPSPPHSRTSLPAPRLEEVSDGVFAYLQPDGSWWLNNTGFLVTRTGVISVDSTSTERRNRDYLAAIASVTHQPVRTLVNTHHHGDHTHGNSFFPQATVVGHERTRDGVLAAGLPEFGELWEPVDWGDLTLEPPFLTYERGITLWADDLRCEVTYVGTPAHTDNDSLVWIPERSTLFAGDLLFQGGTPFLLQGSVEGAIEVLETVVRPLGAQTIVAGHGPVSGPGLIDDVLGYLRFVQDLARRARQAGLSPLEAARESDLGEYAGLTDAERIVGNLHRACAELDGAGRGAPLDAVSILAEMVAYNGGRPLTCLA